VRTLIDAAQLHWPSPAEALLLAAVLGTMLVMFWLSTGPAFAAIVSGASTLGFLFTGDPSITVAVALAGGALLVLSRRGRDLSQPAAPFLRECLLVAGGFLAYLIARLHTEASFETAAANAQRIIDFEHGIGLFFEPAWQGFVFRSEPAVRAFSAVYSYFFLAVVVGSIVWLYAADRPNYRLLRNCLGISAALTVVTIVIFPVAPPRLMPETGILDSVVVIGREHAYANEFAAVPSNHVGWMMLVGFVLWRSIRGPAGTAIGLLPGILMFVTVVVTGNHYWIDGVIGAAYSLVPAAALVTAGRWWPALRRLDAQAGRLAHHSFAVLRQSRKGQTTVLGFAGLLIYLVVGQVVSPGFTDHWGYLFFQAIGILGLLVIGEVKFADQGGLSWQTHLIAIGAIFADTLGTAGDMYANHREYDKIVHFCGIAAVTSAVYDCLRALNRRNGSWPANDRLVAAIAIGVAAGIGWEVYEYVGDNVFASTRIGGVADTTYDLVFDTLGAMVAGVVLWRAEVRGSGGEEEKAGYEVADGGG
jgi:hypothetical protein